MNRFHAVKELEARHYTDFRQGELIQIQKMPSIIAIHLLDMKNLCVKFHKFIPSSLGVMSRTRRKHSTTLIFGKGS